MDDTELFSADESPDAPSGVFGREGARVHPATGAVNAARLDARVARFTTRPSPGQARPGPLTLVVAGHDESLAEAFDLARARLEAGELVHIIAPGVTLERTWPAWVRHVPEVTLIELGAFRGVPYVEATHSARTELRAWVRDILGPTFGGIAPERIFFDAARLRFLEPWLLALPLAIEIARAFPGASACCLRSDSPLAQLIARALPPPGGAPRPRVAARRAWRARVLALGIAAEAVAVTRMTRAYIEAAPTFRAIKAQRRNRVPTPSSWVAVLPDWRRMNLHLLDAFALPETEGGGTLGVMFVGSLQPFERNEADMRKHHGTELWPALGALRERLHQCVVDQAVMPEAPLDFLRAVASGVGRSAVAVHRLSRAATIALPSLEVAPTARDLVSWATLDVLRATLAERATPAFLGRNAMHGKTVVFVAGNVAWRSVDIALQASGATTVEYDHGTYVDAGTTIVDSESSYRLVWIQPDVRLATLPRERLRVAAMPTPARLRPRARPARNILVLSNYVHRDFLPVERRARAIFQAELLEVVRLLARERPELSFRWRPHPADNEGAVQRELATHVGVELSRGRPLGEDAAWADVVVSSASTTVIENMFAGVPVFVQMLPDSWQEPERSFIAPERVFFHAAAGARAVSEWLARYGASPAAGLEPERLARIALFGEAGEPVPMGRYFGREAERDRRSTADEVA